MNCKVTKAFFCTASVLTIAVIAPVDLRAQQQRETNAELMQRAQEAYAQQQRANDVRQAIAQDKAAIVEQVMSRWSSHTGATEKDRIGFSNAFLNDEPEKLFQMVQARTWNEVLAIQLGLNPDTLGLSNADLVFTPLPPCRVMDTRLGTGAYDGPHSAPTNISFSVTDPINAGGKNQGGQAACGFPYATGTGVALNITVVPTGASGDLRIFPYGGTPPNASIVNFYPGINLANAANVAIAFAGGTNDVTINIDYGTDVFLIVDVMGYFAPPVATPLQKTSVTYYYTAQANSSYYVWVNCPPGYTLTGGGFIESGSSPGNWVTASYSSGNSWYVVATNTNPFTVTIGSHGVCSRVPGR